MLSCLWPAAAFVFFGLHCIELCCGFASFQPSQQRLPSFHFDSTQSNPIQSKNRRGHLFGALARQLAPLVPVWSLTRRSTARRRKQARVKGQSSKTSSPTKMKATPNRFAVFSLSHSLASLFALFFFFGNSFFPFHSSIIPLSLIESNPIQSNTKTTACRQGWLSDLRQKHSTEADTAVRRMRLGVPHVLPVASPH